MTSLFRPIKRILSPRENDRGSRGNEDDAPVPGMTGQHPNSDLDSMVVDNVIYSEPTQLDRVPPRRGSCSGGEEPPLPPRPQSANADEHETYYQAPVDTLGRSNTDQQKQQQQQQQQLRSSTRDKERAQERETRQMVMHNKTLSQMAQQSAPVTGNGASSGVVGGHRRTRSGGHVIDNEEYSTPWNVQEMQRRSSAAPPKAPRKKKSGVGRPIPATPSDGSDNIIPVTSPSAILPSHERSQSASPVPPRSPGPSSAEPEYDDPWDVKNRRINQFIPGRHHVHSVHERRSPPPSHLAGEVRPQRVTVGGRIEHSKHLEDVRPSRAMSEKNHNWSPGVLDGAEPVPFRSRTVTDIHSHGLSGSAPNSPRTSSVSMPPHHMQHRPLPEEPSNSSSGSTTTSLPSPSSIPVRREPSPSSTWFDCQLALEEQP